MQSDCNFQLNYWMKKTFLTKFQQMESGQLSFINEKLKEENAGNLPILYIVDYCLDRNTEFYYLSNGKF